MPRLTLRIIGAKLLPEDKGYTVKGLFGKEKFKTEKSKNKSSSPSWNHSVTLELQDPSKDIITLELCQGKKKIYGTINLKLTDLVEKTEKVTWEKFGTSEVNIGLLAVDFGTKTPTPQATTTVPTSGAPKKVSNKNAIISAEDIPPMPALEKLESLFESFLGELGISDGPQFKQMKERPAESKWLMICQQRAAQKEQKTSSTLTSKPQFWVEKLKAEPNVKALRDLEIRLSHELTGWLKEFEELGGISVMVKHLSDKLTKPDKKEEEKELQRELIRAFSKIMNNKTGLDLVMHTPNAVNTLAISLISRELSNDLKLEVIKLLTVICLVPPDGHRIVMTAMSNFKNTQKEKARFETVLRLLESVDSFDHKVAFMTFVNALTNSPDDTDLRMSLRQELTNLGFKEILEKLKKISYEEAPELDTQISTFEEEESLDNEELKKRFGHVSEINLQDEDAVFNALKRTTKEKGINKYLLELLQSLIAMKFEDNSDTALKQWLVASKIVRQIAFRRQKIGEGAGQVNLQNLLASVAEEHSDVVPLKQRISELEEKEQELEKKIENKRY